MDSVAQLGCVACAMLGHYDTPAELHHIKDKTGMGRKASNFEVIPLCPLHHRIGQYSYHYSPAEFTGSFGGQRDLLNIVLDALAIDGCQCGCTNKKGAASKGNPFNRDNIFWE